MFQCYLEEVKGWTVPRITFSSPSKESRRLSCHFRLCKRPPPRLCSQSWGPSSVYSLFWKTSSAGGGHMRKTEAPGKRWTWISSRLSPFGRARSAWDLKKHKPTNGGKIALEWQAGRNFFNRCKIPNIISEWEQLKSLKNQEEAREKVTWEVKDYSRRKAQKRSSEDFAKRRTHLQ